MKPFFVSLIVFLSTMGISITFDLYKKPDLISAIKTAINPFKVMDISEMFILFTMIVVYVVTTWKEVILKKQNVKDSGNSKG